MNWTEMPQFKGIDLNDSFVLSWESGPDCLKFEIEASIWPSSRFYVAPGPNEHTCYRRATLTFDKPESVSGLNLIEQVRPTVDPDGSVDFGTIDGLSRSDVGFLISGDFGAVEIRGGHVRFQIHT